MTQILTLRTLLRAGAALACLAAPVAQAEPGKWSDAPVRIVVTFPPGGTSDLVARILAKHLDAEFGQKAVVDNRPGAGGTVAADFVAGQAPDGTTLILSNNAPFTIAPTQFESLPYDPMTGFSHIAYIGASAPALFVQPSMEIADLDAFIAYAKDKGVTYGSSGVGSITHILGEAVNGKLGIEATHVPYRGSAPAIQDFRAGVLDAFYDMLAQNSEMVEDHEAIPLAIAAPKRLASMPDVPTFAEQGYDIVIENWVGVSGPAGIDPAMAQTIHDSVEAILAMPEVQASLAEWGIATTGMSSADYAAFVANTIEMWKPLIVSAGVQGK